MTNHRTFDIQGHRGARGLYPENTITGFLEAIKLGVTTLEMDVVISKDNKVVVSHEAWMNADFCTKPDGHKVEKGLEKMYNIFGMNYEEILKFDCGIRGNEEFRSQKKLPEHKPLLSEVFTEVQSFTKRNNRRSVNYNIEIKTEPEFIEVFNPEPKKFANLVIDEIRKYKMEGHCNIQSFDTDVLEEIKGTRMLSTIGLLVENKESLEINLGRLSFSPDTYNPFYELVTDRMIRTLHQLGMKIVPWTVNELTDMKKLIEMGVDGIITDYPDRLVKLIK